MVHENGENIKYDTINEYVKKSRYWFINVGSKKQVQNKREISETVAANLLHCDKNILNIYIKHGFLHSNCIDGKQYFLYEWIEDFAKDNRLLDENGNMPSRTGYDSDYYTDSQGRLIITPTIKWIDKDGNETDKPNPQNPPVRYVQLICFNGEKHRHTMGVGGRAQGYYLKPTPEDIEIINQYNLDLGDQYKDLY